MPARLGTQKEWITSVELEHQSDRLARRNVDLVGAGQDPIGLRVLVAHLPPPLMPGDADGEAACVADASQRAVGNEAQQRQANQHDDGDADSERHHSASAPISADVHRQRLGARRRRRRIAMPSTIMTRSQTTAQSKVKNQISRASSSAAGPCGSRADCQPEQPASSGRQ